MGRKSFYFPSFIILLCLIHVNDTFQVLFSAKLIKMHMNYMTLNEKKTRMIEFDIILNDFVFRVLPKERNFAS